MKRALRWILLLCVLAFAWIQYDPGPALILAVPQIVVPHPPDAPPPGVPLPGEPADLRPGPPNFPPDFYEDAKDHKTKRKAIDPVQAQKDAAELAALTKKVQGEVGQLSKNLLSKDLDKDLKQIQKIAKRLRG